MTPIHSRRRWRLAIPFIVLLPLLAGCGGSKDKDEGSSASSTVLPVEDLYNNGIDALNAQRYETATDQFNAVEQRNLE